MKKLTLLLIALLLSTAAYADSIGMVVAVQGDASATGADGIVRELAMSSDIFLNEIVRTGPSARLQILLNDDSLLAQGENSEMAIDEYIYNPAAASENGFGVTLGKGLFRTVTGKITDLNPERFKVKTSRATIGIRGCDLGFDITPKKDNISIITVPKGKTIFIDPYDGVKSLTVDAPLFVVVDDRGRIRQRALTPSDRGAAQRGTTPGARAPEPDPVDAELDGAGIIGGGLAGGDDDRSLINEGTIIQSTEQKKTHCTDHQSSPYSESGSSGYSQNSSSDNQMEPAEPEPEPEPVSPPSSPGSPPGYSPDPGPGDGSDSYPYI